MLSSTDRQIYIDRSVICTEANKAEPGGEC